MDENKLVEDVDENSSGSGDEFVFQIKKSVRTIDGSRCSKSKAVGFCWSVLHKGYLTKRQMDKHECLEKECSSFQRIPDAQYWIQTEKKRERNREKRLIAKEKKRRKELFLKIVRDLTVNDSKFWAVSVDEENEIYFVKFIKFGYIDFKEYCELFRMHCECECIYLKEIKADASRKKEIIRVVGINKNFDSMEDTVECWCDDD